MSSTEQLRVLQVVTSVAAGGLSRYMLDLMANLNGVHCEMHLACTHFEGPHFDEATRVAASATVLAARSQRAKLSQLVKLIRKLRPHVVHAHQEPVAQIAARLAGVPIRIETIHLARYWLSDCHPVTRAMSRSSTTAHIVYTECEKAIISRQANPGKVKVVNPGLDTSRWKDYWSRSTAPLADGISIMPDDFVIGTIARLDDQKGVCYLLDACPAILKECPTARFLIVGDGSLRRELEQQCIDLKIADRVIFAGYQLDAYQYLGAMDLFVMSSLFESWGFTALEAMWAALPVVCTDIPGPQEFIRHEQTGLMVESANSEAIAAAVVRLWYDGELRSSIANAAAKHVCERHSINAMGKQYMSLYSQKHV